jgi:uncharacterized membrane protein (DUF2068 family)
VNCCFMCLSGAIYLPVNCCFMCLSGAIYLPVNCCFSELNTISYCLHLIKTCSFGVKMNDIIT